MSFNDSQEHERQEHTTEKGKAIADSRDGRNETVEECSSRVHEGPMED